MGELLDGVDDFAVSGEAVKGGIDTSDFHCGKARRLRNADDSVWYPIRDWVERKIRLPLTEADEKHAGKHQAQADYLVAVERLTKEHARPQ